MDSTPQAPLSRRAFLRAAAAGTVLAGIGSGQVAHAQRPRRMAAAYTVARFAENPIIRPDMLPGTDGANVNGPSLIKVPDWVTNPLGRYYLYFAHHYGTYIRLAYADALTGPWTIHAPGALTVDQVRAQAKKRAKPGSGAGTRHIASPDVHVDDAARKIRMYFHAQLADPYISWEHHSGVAASVDGLGFTLENTSTIGPPYFRVFRYGAYHYAVANRAVVLRSIDGVKWEKTQNANFPASATDPATRASPRHVAVQLDGNVLTTYYTRISDAPERVQASSAVLDGAWLDWRLSTMTEVVRPEHEYEGVLLPVKKSRSGDSFVAEHALRDPAIYREDGRTYLLYACKGETGGIAIAELSTATSPQASPASGAGLSWRS